MFIGLLDASLGKIDHGRMFIGLLDASLIKIDHRCFQNLYQEYFKYFCIGYIFIGIPLSTSPASLQQRVEEPKWNALVERNVAVPHNRV